MNEATRGDQYHRWAFDIARDPRRYPEVSIRFSLGALTAWNEPIPKALEERAIELKIIKIEEEETA